MTNHASNTPYDRRDEILHDALREQALAHRGRRVLSASASVALIAIVAGVVMWRFLPTSTPTSPTNRLAESSEDKAIRELMAGQPRISTPAESYRHDPRYRLALPPQPRLIVERVSTSPGLAGKFVATPAKSTITRATDDDLALALHAADPDSGLVRVDGRLFAAMGGTLVCPEDLPAPAHTDTKPQSTIGPRSGAIGV